MWSGNCGTGELRNPVRFQDQEFLPEKEVEEQRYARGFFRFLSDPQEGAVQELLGAQYGN